MALLIPETLKCSLPLLFFCHVWAWLFLWASQGLLNRWGAGCPRWEVLKANKHPKSDCAWILVLSEGEDPPGKGHADPAHVCNSKIFWRTRYLCLCCAEGLFQELMLISCCKPTAQIPASLILLPYWLIDFKVSASETQEHGGPCLEVQCNAQ